MRILIRLRVTDGEQMMISYKGFRNPEQAKGDSVRRQDDPAVRWCREHGKTLTDQLSDKGVSAFRGKNAREGDLAQFLALVRAGTVPAGSYLLVEELDRLSRERPEESIGMFLSIIRAGVVVVNLRKGIEFRRGE